MKPEWPERALESIPKFYEPLQDVTIFIEDEASRLTIEVYLKRLLEPVRVQRVTGLGGRRKVIEHAKRMARKRKKRVVYLIDGDLDFAYGCRARLPKNVVQIDAYCIENFFLCRDAITSILAEELVITDQEAYRRLRYDKWIQNCIGNLSPVFAAYAIAHATGSGVQTTKYTVHKLCKSHRRVPGRQLCPKLCKYRAEDVLGQVRIAKPKASVQQRLARVNRRIDGLTDPSRAISGKDYLLELLTLEFRRLKCHVRPSVLAHKLAKHCSLDAGTTTRESIFRLLV